MTNKMKTGWNVINQVVEEEQRIFDGCNLCPVPD